MQTNSGEQKPLKDKGGRAKDTLFRIASRNQIELIAIADNKSNLIIGICVLLISLLLAILGSGVHLMDQGIAPNLTLMIPLSVLLVFLVAAGIFAIMAAKPHIIKGRPGNVTSLLFFRNISTRTQEQYLDEMRSVLRDKNQVYDQLAVDMYFNGLVLTKKYKMLNTAYILFMFGLIAAVLTCAMMFVVR